MSTITRPTRWSEPFGDGMTDEVVNRLLGVEPFKSMNPAAFPATLPLVELIRGDTRLMRYEPGDVILLEGDYGNSALLMLHGTARATLDHLDGISQQRTPNLASRVIRSVAQLWHKPSAPEVRRMNQIGPHRGGPAAEGPLGARGDQEHTRLFLQDVPGVLDSARTTKLQAGEIFGEVAALSRTPGVATVFAETDVLALEIRWQGLRDLMRYGPAFSEHIHTLYRRNSLQAHLRETPLMAGLDEAELT